MRAETGCGTVEGNVALTGKTSGGMVGAEG